MKTAFPLLLLCLSMLFSCSSDDVSATSQNPIPQNPNPQNPDPTNPDPTDPTPSDPGTIRYLAFGDSYTIGQNVCETCRFPEQLKQSLQSSLGVTVDLEVIATTGWTTTNLISAINLVQPPAERDIVTLLIGVNNQYQHKPFSLYESEFPQLVNTAIALAKGDKENVIVVSIPDYAYTPYGQGSSDPSLTSAEIDQYNAFAQTYCAQQNIVFVNITDITRQGLSNPSLVASDGLHPSSSAYSQFVSRILPKALETLP